MKFGTVPSKLLILFSTQLLLCVAGPAASSATVKPVAQFNEPLVGGIFRSKHRFFGATENAIEAFTFADPATVQWNITFNSSTCGIAPSSDPSASTSVSSGVGYALRSMVVIDDDRLLLYCASRIILVNAQDGFILKEHQFLDGDVIVQFSLVDASVVVIGLLPSADVVVFDVEVWQVLWTRHGNRTIPPIVCGSAGIVVVVDFKASFAGFVQGFDASTGIVVFNVTMVMWNSPRVSALPLYSMTVFAWFGPDFASVRVVYLPTGAFWQFVPPYVIQFMYPTDDGLLVLASTTTVTVLDVKNQTVLWSRWISPSLDYGRVSFDGAYLMLQGDMSTPTIVVEIRTGTHVGTCGTTECADPCVVGVPSQSIIVLTNCTSNGAQLMLLDNKTLDLLYEGASLPAANSINASTVGPIGGDLIGVVGRTFRILQIERTVNKDVSLQPPFATIQIVVAISTTALLLLLVVTAAVARFRHKNAVKDDPAVRGDLNGLRAALSVDEP